MKKPSFCRLKADEFVMKKSSKTSTFYWRTSDELLMTCNAGLF